MGTQVTDDEVKALGPLPLNAGGNLDPKHVVGRDRQIARIWELIRNRSISMTSDRRIGKTNMLGKMLADGPTTIERDGRVVRVSVPHLAFARDVSGIDSGPRFVERLYGSISDKLREHRSVFETFMSFLKKFQEIKIADTITLSPAGQEHWQDYLRALFAELHDRNADELIVFVWDELPWMLQKIEKTHGPGEVIGILDCLREARQAHHRLRMIYTGSIGLHHVIEDLRRHGYINEPVSDMHIEEVGPLEEREAILLGARLMLGRQINGPKLVDTAAAIADETGRVPYYIQSVVQELHSGSDPEPARAAEAWQRLLTHDQNVLDLEHYSVRLDEYYGLDGATKARALLDVLAAAGQALPLAELPRRAGASADGTAAAVTLDDARRLTRLLRRDHYLAQQPNGDIGFRLAPIARWWRLQRGL